MFTRRVSTQAKWMLMLVILPLYFYCGSLIASAIIKFLVVHFSLSVDNVTLTSYLNLGLDAFFALIGFFILKDSLIEQWKDFKKDLKNNLFYGVVVGTAILFAANIAGSLFSLLFGMNEVSQNQSLIEQIAIAHPYATLMTTVILAPIFEEILFRGMIFGWLYEVHPYIAHLVSGFIFGFIHIMSAVFSGDLSEWFLIFPYIFMGLSLSYLYEKRNTIYVPILAHACSNLISVLMILL